MQEDRFTVGPREDKRAQVLNRLLTGEWAEAHAAGVLGLSVRQVRRLKRAYREEGIRALIHHNQGRPAPHALDPTLRAQVVTLATTRYAGCNDQHLTELLAEREGIGLSRSSVRRILRDAGLRSPRQRQAPKHRSRRERYPQAGMLLQIDGSRHQWLGRLGHAPGPYLTLIGAIDDATGTVPAAVFRAQEDAQGYILLLAQIVQTAGIPLALYHDRHSIFTPPTAGRVTIAEQLTGRPDLTQFARVLDELQVASIPAQSPQAKGRIERLWGTFQDRLVMELRLAGLTPLSSLAEVNAGLAAFLPRFNTRFAVPPAQPGSAYRPVPPGFCPEQVFCFKYQRAVAPDNTVQCQDTRLQLLPDRHRASYAKATVEVQVRMDGEIAVFCQGRQIGHQPAPAEAPVLRTHGSRIPRRLPAPPPAPRPLPWDAVHERLHPDTLATGVTRPGTGPGAPGQPGPNHPWRTRPLLAGGRARLEAAATVHSADAPNDERTESQNTP
jgi:transposase